MPGLYALEKLHQIDDSILEPRREYVKEIWDVLENEPEANEAKSFAVCQLDIRNGNEIVLLTTGFVFPHHILAEEWIKESGATGTQYMIMEIIESI